MCYGDVIDDIVATPDGPIRHDTDTPSTLRIRPGGSAANAAAWIGPFGADVVLVGVVGRGEALRHGPQLPAVTAKLREHPSLPTGRIVVIVHRQRRDMLIDRGATIDLSPDDVTDDLLAGARLLHFTGHVLLNSAGFAGVRRLIDRCREAGVAVSVSPGSAGCIEDLGAERVRRAFAGAAHGLSVCMTGWFCPARPSPGPL